MHMCMFMCVRAGWTGAQAAAFEKEQEQMQNQQRSLLMGGAGANAKAMPPLPNLSTPSA